MRRDPNKTARNKRVAIIKQQRRELQENVFAELEDFESGRYCNEASLNAFIGSKTDEYINLTDDVIRSPVEYQSRWLSGLKKALIAATTTGSDPRHKRIAQLISPKSKYRCFRKYLSLFLEGSFLKHYEEHYKTKPKIGESEYWFGNNDDEFGLLVTPRYTGEQWENDKSEIRHFSHPYWTIAHLMETGLCYMGEHKVRTFSEIGDYLQFFRDLVRRTKSPHQLSIADKYIEYVDVHSDPLSVPVLISELRYDPFKTRHQHRLDFLIINPWSMEKYGFELSPWRTHGKLDGAKRSLKELNKAAQANFEKEMQKHKKYWRKFGVTYIIYTDEDLSDIESVWFDIQNHLDVTNEPYQLDLALLGLLE